MPAGDAPVDLGLRFIGRPGLTQHPESFLVPALGAVDPGAGQGRSVAVYDGHLLLLAAGGEADRLAILGHLVLALRVPAHELPVVRLHDLVAVWTEHLILAEAPQKLGL